MGLPDFSNYDWGSLGGPAVDLSGLGAQLGASVPDLSNLPGGLPPGINPGDIDLSGVGGTISNFESGGIGGASQWVDMTSRTEYQLGSAPISIAPPALGYTGGVTGGMDIGDPWEQERKRLKGIASGAIEDPSVIAMRKQQALAGAQAYGAVPEMQSAATRSRLQRGARGAVELGAGQALKARRLEAQQAAQQNLAQQLAQKQATEQRRLEEERRSELAAELTRAQADYRRQAADQAAAAALAQAGMSVIPGLG